MEANRNAQNLQLAHEIVFNKDFQLQLPEYEKGRLGKRIESLSCFVFYSVVLVLRRKFMIQCIQLSGIFYAKI